MVLSGNCLVYKRACQETFFPLRRTRGLIRDIQPLYHPGPGGSGRYEPADNRPLGRFSSGPGGSDRHARGKLLGAPWRPREAHQRPWHGPSGQRTRRFFRAPVPGRHEPTGRRGARISWSTPGGMMATELGRNPYTRSTSSISAPVAKTQAESARNNRISAQSREGESLALAPG